MEVNWFDFTLFAFLLAILVYVLTVSSITTLHKAYLAFHSLMMFWPACNFFIHITPDQKLQWVFLNIAFVGLCFLGYGWLIFSLVLIKKIDSLRRLSLYLWATPALICSILVTTNPWHFLFAQPSSDGWPVRFYGPFFWLFVLSCTIYLVAATTFMLRTLKHVPDKVIKKQLIYCMLGIVLLLIFCILDVLFNVVFYPRYGVVPGLTSLGIIISAVCFVVAIQKYDLFRIISIAQREVIDTMPTGMLVLDKNAMVLDLNRRAQEYFKIKPGQIFDIRMLRRTDTQEVLADLFFKEYHSNYYKNIQTEITLGEEQAHHISINVLPLLDSKKSFLGRIITFHDVTELRSLIRKINDSNAALTHQNQELLLVHEQLSEANKKLEQMAITDALTGCYNKRYLLQQLTHEVALAQRSKIAFSMVLIDLDNFKCINDSHGHLIGDIVLRGVADIMKKNIRKSDILARFGGEEFVIYLPHTDQDGAVFIAERIRHMVEIESIKTFRGDLRVTVSLGLVSVDPGAEHIKSQDDFLDMIIARADSALYQAKSNGRNCLVVAGQ